MGVNYGKPSDLDKYFQKTGYPNRDMSDEERLLIMRGSLKQAKKKSKNSGRGPAPA